MKYEIYHPYRPSRSILAISVQDVIRWAVRHEIELEDFEECYAGLQEHAQRGWMPRLNLSTSSPEYGEFYRGQFEFDNARIVLGSVGVAQVAIEVENQSGLQTVTILPETEFTIKPAVAEMVRSTYATV